MNAEVRTAAGTLGRVFAVAAAVNYPWEVLQAPLYEDLPIRRALWHCLPAALGDGLLVVAILAAGRIAFGRPDWYVRPGAREYALMLATGTALATLVEWAAVHLAGRWAYSARMPLVPGLGVGAVPVLQMVLLPPAVFWLAGAWTRSAVNTRHSKRRLDE